jgi:hypothetical protein
VSDSVSWATAPDRLPACGVDHGRRPGRLDETARRLDHPELAVAERLVDEGHDVVTVAERGRRGPVPDFMVCGQPVEVKRLLTMDERGDGYRATAATVHNRLVSARAQAATVLIDTSGSGCKVADAVAGLRSFAATGDTGKVAAVRIVGDGFDLSWLATPARERGRRAGEERTAPSPEPDGPEFRPTTVSPRRDRSAPEGRRPGEAADAPAGRPGVADAPAARRAPRAARRGAADGPAGRRGELDAPAARRGAADGPARRGDRGLSLP